LLKKVFAAVVLACAGFAAAVAVAGISPTGPFDTTTTGTTASSTDTTSSSTSTATSTDTGTTATGTTAAGSTATTGTTGTSTTTTTPVPVPPQPISYGVADDSSKYAEDGGAVFDKELLGAGLTENRWTLAWDPANPTAIEELPLLEHAAPVAQAAGVHIVLALYSKQASRHNPISFCTWAGQVADTVRKWGITDFIVWNEPNTRLFWYPQKDRRGRDVAGPAYEALLATCYDAIKGANPDATVVGMGLSPRASTRASNEPLTFLRDVGAAYRRSGRTLPIMDQLAIHPYPNPNRPNDAPSVGYPSPLRYGLSNLARVKQAVWEAFRGTAQPTTLNGLTLRVDEIGWQVGTAGLSGYVNTENVHTVNQATQAAYLAQMVQVYLACDPAVTDVLLFLLVDEKYRNGRDETGRYIGGGWQSGLVTVTGAQRLAYATMAQLAPEGRAACSSRTVAWRPARVVKTKPGKKAHAKKAPHKR
jgi:hypothetical protein